MYLSSHREITETNVAEIAALASQFHSEELRIRCFHFVLSTSVKPEFIESLDDEMKERLGNLFIAVEAEYILKDQSVLSLDDYDNLPLDGE